LIDFFVCHRTKNAEDERGTVISYAELCANPSQYLMTEQFQDNHLDYINVSRKLRRSIRERITQQNADHAAKNT
jgi:hypothetical protein